MSVRIDDIQQGAKAGTEWLLSQQTTDGRWADLVNPKFEAYYKGGWTFAQTGHYTAAHQLLNHVEDEFLTDTGDFQPRAKAVHEQIQHVYSNSYVVTGSMMARRYDIARSALRFIKTRQDPRLGGFYSQQRTIGEESQMDTMSSSCAGVGLLSAGDIEGARQVGEFLAWLKEEQPDSETTFYTVVRSDGELYTDVAEEREAYADEDWFRVVETGKSNQCWYSVGLPFAFLAQLYLATGEQRYKDLADWYFRFQERCVDPWTGGSSGKAGWGSSILYLDTGEEKYREAAATVADYILGRQFDNGGWYEPDENGNYDNGAFDATAEFTLWLSLIGSNLASGDSAH